MNPFEYESLKLTSSFNPASPFQLELLFSCIVHELQKQEYKLPRKKNLTKEEIQAIGTLRINDDIIIKPADMGRPIVIMYNTQYINVWHRQLSSTEFYEPTDTDLTDQFIQWVNLHAHDMLQRDQTSQKNMYLFD